MAEVGSAKTRQTCAVMKSTDERSGVAEMGYILGLSFDFHDSAAALVKDGVVVAAGIEERFSRIKHDASFPRKAIEFCFHTAGVSAADIEAVAYYEVPMLKFDRILWSCENAGQRNPDYLDRTVASWLRYRKFEIADRIFEELGIAKEKISYVGHHISHMSAAFLLFGIRCGHHRHHGRCRGV